MRKLLTSTALVLTLLFSCNVEIYPQADDYGLTSKRINLKVEKATLLYVLSTLAIDERIPIGFEESDADRHEAKITIDVENASVQDVMNAVIVQEPSYTWEFRDDVINVVPAVARDELLSTLLNTQIERFEPEKGSNKFEIRDAVLNLAEVRRLLSLRQANIDRFNYPVYASVFSDPKVDLSVRSTDVRGVLNKIVRDSEHKLWILKRTEQKKSVRLGF